jgi:hypothetical protein
MAQRLGMDDAAIEHYLDDIHAIPLDTKLALLLEKAIKSIYASHRFGREDFEALYAAGWSDKTIYEMISYATQFEGISKRINTYLVKES